MKKTALILVSVAVLGLAACKPPEKEAAPDAAATEAAPAATAAASDAGSAAADGASAAAAPAADGASAAAPEAAGDDERGNDTGK